MRLCCAVTIIEYGNKDVSQHVSPYFQRFKWWIFIRSAHKQLFKCAKENFKNLYHRKMKMFIRKTKCQDKLLSFVKWKFSNLKHICTNNEFNFEHEKFLMHKSFHTFVEHKESLNYFAIKQFGIEFGFRCMWNCCPNRKFLSLYVLIYYVRHGQ